MKWDIRFEATPGNRVKKRFWGATIMVPTDLWWDGNLRKWVDYESRSGVLSTHTDTRSYKAFLRLLRKHPELPMYEISPNVIRGRVLLDKDLVIFETDDLLAVRKKFEEAIDDYIETCAELGRKPRQGKPYDKKSSSVSR